MKLLWGIAAIVVVCYGTTNLNLCDDGDVRCQCHKPNKNLGKLIRVDDEEGDGFCFCSCGEVEGEPCATDDECCVGTYCGPPARFDAANKSLGLCTSECERYHCEEFHTCSIINGLPECKPSSYKCTREVDIQVCAIDRVDNYKKKNFYNLCELVNEEAERWRRGHEETLARIDCVTDVTSSTLLQHVKSINASLDKYL